MKKYHVISAKRMGWDNGDNTYEHFFFPEDRFTETSALAEFKPVQRQTLKNNNLYPYTAYEYKGEVFYSISYRGMADESEI